MAKFSLPIVEVMNGYYIIEAKSLADAKRIAERHDFTETHDPEWNDGMTEWDVDDIEEME
ncbi:hypothetical protein UFOVP536_59 [uncultured Caudovirales phage]|uniref:Uncharacterized protein n=1 Tax=uncultured Caudovirales phage TaxID=2100421 RepID=A0A6J5MRA1_9CAUD|nr:hypothetical protein UFOVP536_59 [uncultured Caudovirales phage]